VQGSGLWLALALAASEPTIEALGIVTSPDPARYVAILRSSGTTRIVGPGDSAFGGLVEAIEADRVRITRPGGEVLEVLLSGAVAAQSPSPAPVAAPRHRSEPAPPELLAVTLERAEVDRRLIAEIPQILAGTRLMPVRENGSVLGFSLEEIPSGTLLDAVGLRPGDVLTHVNRVPLDSMATLVGLWPRLQGATELTAQVLRGGEPVSLSVSLR
jgi:general secretion pathway protein C